MVGAQEYVRTYVEGTREGRGKRERYGGGKRERGRDEGRGEEGGGREGESLKLLFLFSMPV